MSPPKTNKLTRAGSLVNPPVITPAGTNTAGTEPRRIGARRRLDFGRSPGATSSTDDQVDEGDNSKKRSNKNLPTVSEVAESASKKILAFNPLRIPHRSKRKTPNPSSKQRQLNMSKIAVLSASASMEASRKYHEKVLREAIDEAKQVTKKIVGSERRTFNEKIKKLEQESKRLLNQKLALQKKRANEELALEKKRVDDELQEIRKEARETLILAERALRARYETGSPNGRPSITRTAIENHSKSLAERRKQEKSGRGGNGGGSTGGRGGNGGGSTGGRGGNGGGRRKGLLTPKRLTFNNINEKIKTSKKRTELERKLELKNYITKKDFNKLVEKLDKPRTPSKEQLTKNNVAEMLKPLLNKKQKQTKFSLFGSLGDIDKKKLAGKKPESVVRAVVSKLRKEVGEKIKPRTPRVSHSKTRPSTPRVSHSKTRPSTPRVYTRTPTTGQRKKHVIELIDRVLRRMKVRKDIEKKLMSFYEALSERYIKNMFGGRTKEEVKAILKKQVSYFSKKR